MKRTTREISEELIEQEGISHINIEPYEKVTITTGREVREYIGPAIIIVNQD